MFQFQIERKIFSVKNAPTAGIGGPSVPVLV